jgi:hypothetical protein
VIDHDILLVLSGGVIGAFSSFATLLLVYALEGMRLRRQWKREDQLQLRQNRAQIEELLRKATQTKEAQADVESEV